MRISDWSSDVCSSDLMIRQYEERIAADGATPEEYKTLIDDVMEAHQRDPDLVPKGDLVMLMNGPYVAGLDTVANRSEEHTSELQSLMRSSYAVFCLKKKN